MRRSLPCAIDMLSLHGIGSFQTMNLKYLRTFISVWEHGTLTKAAEMLHITQPALSRQISALEREFGFELFERTGRGLQLTTRGESVLEDCRALLAQASELSERAQELQQREIERLRVAATDWMIERAFPTLLRELAECLPGVKVLVVEAKAAEHLGMLHRGDVQLAATIIHTEFHEDHFAYQWLPHFDIVAAGVLSPELGQIDTIDVRQLTKHPLLLPKRGFATRELFDAACRLAGVMPNVVFESTTPHALLALAEAGHGMAILPSFACTHRAGLHVTRVMNRKAPLPIAPAVMWDRRRMPWQYAQEFSELLATHFLRAFPQAYPAENPIRHRRSA
jgi:DNA-binding transcriptional LysR family regulator